MQHPSGAVPRVLVVEGDPVVAHRLKEQLHYPGHVEIRAMAASLGGGIAAAAELGVNGLDAVLLDFAVPDGQGLEGVRDFHRMYPRLPIVVTGGRPDVEAAVGAMRHGAQDYLVGGPHEPAVIVRALRLAMERKRLADIEQLLVRVVSHDLRAPLQTILFACDLVRQVPSEAPEMIERCHRAALRASDLVNDLVDATRVRLSGMLPIELAPIDIAVVVADAVDDQRLANPSRALVLTDEGPLVARVDARRLTQVVLNLLGNAIQHSPEYSTIRIGLRVAGPMFELTVHNLGEPIPDWLRPRLFEPLERAGARTQSRTHSVGLGLFIVHEIVKAHAGTIDVDSTPTGGTTFAVRIPTGV